MFHLEKAQDVWSQDLVPGLQLNTMAQCGNVFCEPKGESKLLDLVSLDAQLNRVIVVPLDLDFGFFWSMCIGFLYSDQTHNVSCPIWKRMCA